MSTKQELQDKIEGMILEIEEARVNLSQGKDFGLEDIGTRLEKVREEVDQLEDSDAVLLRPSLETLKADLSHFSWELGEISRRLKEIEEQEAKES